MHPCLDVVAVKYVHYIPISIFNRNNEKQALRKHPISLTDSDHDYILEEIEHREKTEVERNSRDDGDEDFLKPFVYFIGRAVMTPFYTRQYSYVFCRKLVFSCVVIGFVWNNTEEIIFIK